MAMTAELAVSDQTVVAGPNGVIIATVTVSNSGAIPVNVTGLRPYATKGSGTNPSVSVRCGTPVLMGKQAVANSGSTVYTFDVAFHAPDLGGPEQTIDIGCDVFCADGTKVVPTEVVVTLSART